MSCKCFVIDGLESSTIFIDIPHRFCAKAFHSLGLSSSPTSLKMTRCSTLLSSKSSDFGSPHFHSLHQRNFWVNPPSFLSLFLLLVSLVPSLSVVFSNPHPAHYVFLFFLLAGNLLSCTLGWKPLCSPSCYFSEPLNVPLERNNLYPHLHFLLVIYSLIVLAFSGLKSFMPRSWHSSSHFTDDDWSLTEGVSVSTWQFIFFPPQCFLLSPLPPSLHWFRAFHL